MARYETGRCLLPDRRKECNSMSQQRLADLTGYSRSHISAIERGLYEMKASEAMAFCRLAAKREFFSSVLDESDTTA